jgi:hypothetical protein
MKILSGAAMLAMAIWSCSAFCDPLTSVDIKTLPRATIESRLAGEPWSSDYVYAARLYSEGAKDDAVFWYYVGQLRGRIYFRAHRGQQEPNEAFSAMTAELGESINFYAGNDPVKWANTIDHVLAWDDAHDDPFTPKGEFKSQRDDVRSGLIQLHDTVLKRAAQIKASHERQP